ncbi:MAG: Tol-Pal system protein TolB [Gammaproteobacteria bacterium]|nr:MAG: Tol-Pal system protein TolB [Gammaproteobacteria bacterium]
MLTIILTVGFSGNASAELTIRITQGIEGALPIAVVPLGWPTGTAPPPLDIASIVSNDLRRSGRFSPLSVNDLPGRPTEGDDIRFGDWRLLGTQNLVIGKLIPRGEGRFTIQFRLFDIFRAKQLAGYEFDAAAHELRRTAHQISDIVYELLTGEKGAFNTRIAYITKLRPANSKSRYSLSVADSDGHNAHVILDSAEPILSPSWSPDGRRLAYVSFESRHPRIYIQDLATGIRQQIAAFRGINGAPAWSPDGSRLAMSLSKDGNPEIYILDMATRRFRRLTHHYGIDTEPAWSPDGADLVFTSDRGGRPQIYRMAAGGGSAERITFEGSYNARAMYSPRGNQLALVHGNKGVFRIALLDLENRSLKVLTETALDESPSFAPNGSMILYASTDAQGAALAAVSVDGRVRQRLAVQEGEVREPAWSPFRKTKRP